MQDIIVLTRASPKPLTVYLHKYPQPGIVLSRRDACMKGDEAYRIHYGSFPISSGEPIRAFTTGAPESGIAEYAEDVQIEDLNKDGAPDVALVLKKSNAVAVILANDNEFMPPIHVATGKGPSVVEVGDVNADGLLDLVTANEGVLTGSDLSEGDVSLIFGKGDGTFNTAISLEAGKAPRDVGLGDFNRDGKLDLCVADAPFTAGRSILVRLGNGDGTFQPAEVIAAPDLESLVVIDFNPDVDDDDDIVTNGSVLLSRGNGTFAPAIALSLGFDTTLNRAAVGDLNGDGKPDIVTGSFNNNLVSVFLGNGDGTVRAPRHYSSKGQPQQIAIGDDNEDALPDILVSNSTGGGVTLFGQGNGEFYGTEMYAGVVNPASRSGVSAVTVADFTSDGLPDVVVNGSVGLLAGTGEGKFSPMIKIENAPYASDIVAGDWNGDGKQDLAVGDFRLYIMLGNGNGTFEALTSYELPARTRFLKTALVDSGETIDLIAGVQAPDEVVVFVGDGQGGFVPRPGIPAGIQCNDAVAGDFNGDNKADLVLADGGSFLELDGSLKIALGNGDGTFGTPQPFREKIRPDRIAAGDFNHDQKLDVAVSMEVNQFDWDVEIFLGQGNGAFAPPRPLGLSDYLIFGVVTADVDQDGKLDLGVNVGSEEAMGLRGNGDGTFEPALHGAVPGKRMLVTDLDRDGWPDIVAPSNVGFAAVLRNAAGETGLVRPVLNFLLSTLGLELSWSGVFNDFTLKEADSLSPPTEWRAATNAVASTNGQFRVLLDPSAAKRFFRLDTLR